MKYFTLLFSLLFFSIQSFTQEIKESDVPSAVISSFGDTYTPEGKVNWYKGDAGFTASFKSGGQNVKANFSEEGKWIDTKYEVVAKELPALITDYVTTNFKDAKIKESSLRESATEDNHYYVVLKKESVGSVAELFFDMKGNLLRKNVPDDFLNSSANSLVVNVPAEVVNAFKAKLPDAVIGSWKSDSVFTAFFTNDGMSGRAAFNDTAKWLFTRYTIPEKELPSPVISEVRTNYSGYRVKTSEMVEEPGISTYYYLFVKKDGINQPSVHLFFSIAGKLTRKVSSLDKALDESTEVNETNTNPTEIKNEEPEVTSEIVTPKELPSPITSYIRKNYQGYVIKESVLLTSDKESVYDVKIKKEGKKKLTELTFDVKGKFIAVKGENEENE